MKKSEKILSLLYIVTDYSLIFLFTYTGISKLMDHNNFETTLLQSPIIRNQGEILSWLIPFAELFTVFLLLLNTYKQVGYLLSLLLMAMFTGYITYMILFIPHLPCSCGGILKELSWSNHLLLNSFLIMLIIISLHSISKNKNFIAINRLSRKPV